MSLPPGLWPALRQRLKPIWYRFFSHHPHHYVGAVLWAGLRREERDRCFSFLFQSAAEKPGVRARCLYTYLMNRYYAQYADSPTTPEPNRRLLWGAGPATQYHLETLAYYADKKEEFERDHAPLLTCLTERLRTEEYACVVEIGCGNGLLLERLAAEAVQSRAVFVGLDLDLETIALNRKRYPDSRVRYQQRDTLEEFLVHEQPRSALVIANGTFEYFTEKELLHCLAALPRHTAQGTLIVSACTGLDLAREHRSRPTGGMMFSHNYPFLFRQAGLENIHCRIESHPGSAAKNILVEAAWGGSAPLRLTCLDSPRSLAP